MVESGGVTAGARPGPPGGSVGPPADVDEFVASVGHPGLAAGVDIASAVAAEPVAGLGTEASIWFGTVAAVPGPDGEPDIVPTAESGV